MPSQYQLFSLTSDSYAYNTYCSRSREDPDTDLPLSPSRWILPSSHPRSSHKLQPCFTTEHGGRCTLWLSALPSPKPFLQTPGSLPRNPGICPWSNQLQAGSVPLPRLKAPPPWERALSRLRYQKLGRSDQFRGAAEDSPNCPRALACPYQLPAPARCIPGRGLIQTLA